MMAPVEPADGPVCPLCGQPTEDDLDTIMVTRETAAKRVGVGINKIDEWSWEPGFPILREAHFVRIHIDELSEWLRERSKQTNLYRPVRTAKRPTRGRRTNDD
jgi:hypothetical protein